MNKFMYQVDNSGYRDNLIKSVESLHEKHGNAIQTLGGVLSAYEYAESSDLHKFCQCLSHVILEAQLSKWHSGISGAMKTFCNLCLIDYALVECYLGMSFNDIEEYVLANCPMRPVSLV